MSQQLSLTPQLQQAIRLLQLSTQEMEQEVARMLEENPMLESRGGDACPFNVIETTRNFLGTRKLLLRQRREMFRVGVLQEDVNGHEH